MPHYYFHLHNDVDADDEEGADLPDLAAARAYAVENIRSVTAASIIEQGRINLHHFIAVADETGQIVLTVEFGEAFTIEG